MKMLGWISKMDSTLSSMPFKKILSFTYPNFKRIERRLKTWLKYSLILTRCAIWWNKDLLKRIKRRQKKRENYRSLELSLPKRDCQRSKSPLTNSSALFLMLRNYPIFSGLLHSITAITKTILIWKSERKSGEVISRIVELSTKSRKAYFILIYLLKSSWLSKSLNF